MSIKLPDGVDLIHLDSVGSTMAEATRRAPDLNRPTWIIADHQTASHGRRGRAWSSPAGNFSGTLLMRPECPPMLAAQRSFVAAIALYQSLSELTDPAKLSLKWPNDVLLNDRKVAGILLESSSKGDTVDWLSVGIGVNLLAAPRGDEVETGALAPISLADAGGAKLSNLEFLQSLASHFDHWEQELVKFGFEPIRDKWLNHAARLGEVITARTSQETWTGQFDTVDLAGNLVLNTSQGSHAIAAADVYF